VTFPTWVTDLFANFWVSLGAKLLLVALLIPLIGMVIGFAEMKLSAKMQYRVGPYFAGGRWGWAQLIADGVKFFQKEDIIPTDADRPVFKSAPILVLVGTVALFVVIPFGPNLIFRDLDVGIFYALAVSSLSTIGVLMAGWSSANKYSLIGGLRAAGQLIAYELPLVLAAVGPVILAGTMSLQGIVQAQVDAGIPFILFQVVAFVIFMIAALAELTRIPFDMPIAESELVMGYVTEYSGFRFLFFFLAEFANMFTMSAIAVTLFATRPSTTSAWDGSRCTSRACTRNSRTWPASVSISSPARRSTPRIRTSTRCQIFRPSRVARASSRNRSGRTTGTCSRCT
jgi:NADH-quinone oxidoreductase subunit H